MNRSLEEILEDYENTRQSYRNFVTNSSSESKDTFREYESRFVDLKADLRPHRKFITGAYEKRSDKQATAIKSRIAIAIHRGEHEDFEECSINQAEKFAAGSKEYREFLEQKSFYKESYVNISDLREDITTYINEIKDYIR